MLVIAENVATIRTKRKASKNKKGQEQSQKKRDREIVKEVDEGTGRR